MSASSPVQLKAEGLQLFQQGRYDEALRAFETAVTAYTEQEDLAGQAEMLNNIGVIQRVRKQKEAAIVAFQEAQRLFAQLNDRDKEAQTLANLADLYRYNNQPDEAARCYSQAAVTFSQTGNRQMQSDVLQTYSLMQMRRGQWLEALMRMEESLTVRPSLGAGTLVIPFAASVYP